MLTVTAAMLSDDSDDVFLDTNQPVGEMDMETSGEEFVADHAPLAVELAAVSAHLAIDGQSRLAIEAPPPVHAVTTTPIAAVAKSAVSFFRK